MTTINDIQDAIIEEFSEFEDWMDRYQLLIEYGNSLKPFPEEARTDSNLIDGCQSKVWLYGQVEEGTTAPSHQQCIIFKGDSDAILVKGIVALLIRVLSGHTPQEIVEADLYFLDEIQLREHLSPSRTNGVNAMLKEMRLFAAAVAAKREGTE